MKTNKFFFKNNRLNKGYNENTSKSDSVNARNFEKFDHILPPLEVLQEYEDIYPGCLEKIIKLAEKEQEHKHKADLEVLKLQELRLKMTKNLAYLGSIIFSCFALVISIFADNVLVSVATIIAMLVIAGSLIKYGRKLPSPERRKINNFRSGKFNARYNHKYR